MEVGGIMNQEQQLLNLLQDQAYSFQELKNILKIDEITLYQILKNLIEDFIVLKTTKDHYIAMDKSDYRVGQIEKNYNGTAFVRVHDGVVRIAPEFAKSLARGDIVKVKLVDQSPKVGLPEEIVSKTDDLLTGTVYFEDGRKFIKVDGSKYRRLKIQLSESDRISDNKKVLFKLGKQFGNCCYDAHIIKVLGNVTDPDIDMVCLLEKKKIPYIFPDEVLEEVKNIPDHVSESELVGRTDYRSKNIFTIDGKDAKDFDDAVSIELNERGNYVVGIHIADVSHYVKENTAIFEEALKRGTSIYLTDRVIPMLPEELSNGICSLNEGVDRLTMSTEIELTLDGEIVDYHINEGVIHSKKRMNYTDVNRVLAGENVPSYEPFSTDLKMLQKLSTVLQNKSNQMGRVDFEREESYVVMDGREVKDIVLRQRGPAEKLIEEMMILNNRVIATHLFNLNLPGAYRGHHAPDTESLERMDTLLEALQVPLSFSLSERGNQPIWIAKALEQSKEYPYYNVISYHMLRSMCKAEYYPVPTPHFGLGIGVYGDSYYTHFTSPIRRWNDFIIHRVVKDLVLGHNYTMERIEELEEKLPLWATTASVTERQAMDLEREVAQMKKCEYLEKHKSEIFTGNLMEIHEKHITIDVGGLFRVFIPVHTISNFEVLIPRVSYQDSEGAHCLGEEVSLKISEISVEKGFIYGVIEKQKVLRKENYGNR